MFHPDDHRAHFPEARDQLRKGKVAGHDPLMLLSEVTGETDAWIWRIDLEGTYTFSSDGVMRVLGYEAEEVIGRKFYSFFHPDDREQLTQRAMDAIALGRPFLGFRNRNLRKDGAVVILETTGLPILSSSGEITGYYGCDRDITELVDAERLRQESEEMFQHIFEQLGDAAYVSLWRDAGRREVVEANREALRRVGGKEEKLLGRDLIQDFPIASIEPDSEEVLAALKRGETARYVISRLGMDQEQRWEEVIEVPVTYRGGQASLSINRDITEAKRVQEELLLTREQWRAQYKASPLPTMTWRHVNGDFELVDYNDALYKLTKGKIPPFLGDRVSEMYPERPEIRAAMLECYRTHRSLQGEMEHRLVSTGDVRTLWVTTGFVPPDLVLVHAADISERKRMERELRKANEDLKRILDVMGEGVVVLDAEGRMTRLNKSACELFGVREDSLLGKNYASWTHPESRELMARQQRARRNGAKSSYDTLLMRSDGTPFWTHIIAVPIIDDVGEYHGSVGCLRDVTREKESLEQLQRLHAFNEQLIKTAGVWISVTDSDGRVVVWNDEAEKISGYSRDEVLGNDDVWGLLFPDEKYREMLRTRHDALGRNAEELRQVETVIRCKSGEERTIHWYGRPRYDTNNARSGWVLAGHDVTEARKNLQLLRDYAARVERLSKEKTRFLSVASHELRTPLTIVGGFVDLLSDGDLNQDQRKKIERIKRQLERLGRLLDDLLSVSRIDRGEAPLALSVVDLGEILRSAIDPLMPQAIDKGLDVVVRESCAPVNAFADRGAVMQVVTNIVQNAINYTPEGGRIEVSSSSCPGWGKIVVSDTGIGIRDDERELIFGEFHRTERARMLRANGNGLGLSIVKRLVDEMNGRIWVESRGENKGSTFFVVLPENEEPKKKGGEK